MLCPTGCGSCCTGLCTADGAEDIDTELRQDTNYGSDYNVIGAIDKACDLFNPVNSLDCAPEFTPCDVAIRENCATCDEALSSIASAFDSDSESDSDDACTCFGAVSAFCEDCSESLSAVDETFDCDCRDYIVHMYDAGIGGSDSTLLID